MKLEITTFIREAIFLGELEGVFEDSVWYSLVLLAQQWLKSLDQCYFFDIKTILRDGFLNVYGK